MEVRPEMVYKGGPDYDQSPHHSIQHRGHKIGTSIPTLQIGVPDAQTLLLREGTLHEGQG